MRCVYTYWYVLGHTVHMYLCTVQYVQAHRPRSRAGVAWARRDSTGGAPAEGLYVYVHGGPSLTPETVRPDGWGEGGGEGVTVAVCRHVDREGGWLPSGAGGTPHSCYALSLGASAARRGPGSTFWTQQAVEQEREPGAKQQRRAARSARPIDSDGIDAQVRSRVSGGRRRGRRPGVLTGVIVCVRHPLGGPYPISTGSD